MTLAYAATVIPAQAGTHASVCFRNVRGGARRRAAGVILDARPAFITTPVDPGLRRGDVRVWPARLDHSAAAAEQGAARREAMR